MKICTHCKKQKSKLSFHKDIRYKDGFNPWCIDCRKEYMKEYSKLNKYKDYQKEYRKCDTYKSYQKRYSKSEKKKRYQNEYIKTKYKNNLKYRLGCNMSSAVRSALKGKKGGRSWEDLVGYTVEDLMKCLESKFEPWMNWENHGEWQIDHIKPISLFNFTNIEDNEFKECWALSNLQPLGKIENRRKSNKY
mgnify:CR=1 FL=1